MQLSINSNPSATSASHNLSKAMDAHHRSLARLSSGNRIVNPADDAGGLAVGNKLDSKLKRLEKVGQNLKNSISFTQLQEGALRNVGAILTRMSELKTLSMDVTKNFSDVENYNKEFLELQKQVGSITRHKFNGISLFTNINKHDHALQSLTTDDGMQENVVSLARNFVKGEYVAKSGAVIGGKEVTTSFTNPVELNLPALGGTANEETYNIPLDSPQGIFYLWQSTGVRSDTFKVYQGSELLHDKTYGNSVLTLNNGRVLNPEPGSSLDYPSKVNLDEIEFGLNGNQANQLTVVINESGHATGIGSNWEIYAEISYQQTSVGESIELENLDKFLIDDFSGFIQNLASALAQNAAEQSRLNMEIRQNESARVNLEAAKSRIMDADVAQESTRFAKTNVLVQSSASMVAQANQLSEIALRLIVNR